MVGLTEGGENAADALDLAERPLAGDGDALAVLFAVLLLGQEVLGAEHAGGLVGVIGDRFLQGDDIRVERAEVRPEHRPPRLPLSALAACIESGHAHHGVYRRAVPMGSAPWDLLQMRLPPVSGKGPSSFPVPSAANVSRLGRSAGVGTATMVTTLGAV